MNRNANEPLDLFSIRAITFDVDGTLFDANQLKPLTLRFGRPFYEAYLAAREAVRRAGVVCDVRMVLSERIALTLGITVEESRRLIDEMVDVAWADFSHVFPIPGVRSALEALVAHGYRIALLSDYPSSVKMAGLGLDDLPWELEVAAESLGVLKPHSIPFQRAIGALGLPCERILHVGDRIDADVEGAHACGMRTALFAPAGPPAVVPPTDRVFAHFAELVDWLPPIDRKARAWDQAMGNEGLRAK